MTTNTISAPDRAAFISDLAARLGGRVAKSHHLEHDPEMIELVHDGTTIQLHCSYHGHPKPHWRVRGNYPGFAQRNEIYRWHEDPPKDDRNFSLGNSGEWHMGRIARGVERHILEAVVAITRRYHEHALRKSNQEIRLNGALEQLKQAGITMHQHYRDNKIYPARLLGLPQHDDVRGSFTMEAELNSYEDREEIHVELHHLTIQQTIALKEFITDLIK